MNKIAYLWLAFLLFFGSFGLSHSAIIDFNNLVPTGDNFIDAVNPNYFLEDGFRIGPKLGTNAIRVYDNDYKTAPASDTDFLWIDILKEGYIFEDGVAQSRFSIGSFQVAHGTAFDNPGTSITVWRHVIGNSFYEGFNYFIPTGEEDFITINLNWVDVGSVWFSASQAIALDNIVVDPNNMPIPEPSTMVISSLMLLGAGSYVRRKIGKTTWL